MCGIAGLIAFDGENDRPERRLIAYEMGERLNHCGPDDGGLWACTHGALVHRRLSVMDPARGHQPMVRRPGRHEFAIVCNGELYNAPALHRGLTAKGWTLETDCDTEVLLLAYMEWGESCASRLEGVYAFAIWDGIRERFFLCRDRYGVKPLFYAKAADGALLFGSEVKSLFAYPGFPPRSDGDDSCEALEPDLVRTPGCGVLADVKELEPAHCMRVTRSGMRTWRYGKPDA